MDPASAPAAHLPLAPDDGSVWHAGEIALQETAGARLLMQKRGPEVIRDHLIEQHRLFFPLLPFVVLGAVDGEGNVWSTVREGLPGFLVARDPGSLEINSGSDPSDPAEAGLSEGSPVGLLGIQLETRRRNRLNGVVRDRRDGGFAVTVEESYGNCPQYIQQRDFTFSRSPGVRHTSTRVETDALNAHHRALIASADTFFVASYVDRGPRRHVDVSHRGGKPGFVRINADGSLTIPDFSGNLFFNTLGNILSTGRAGLCFPDFETGAMLQISGRAEVILESPEISLFQGAERLWRVMPERIVLRPDALALRWTKTEGGESPTSLMTGSWNEVARQEMARTRALEWRPFRISRRVEESATISSFHLDPVDGEAPIRHEAGQYLPIRVRPPEGSDPLIRTYTISQAPSDAGYRLSIKREGAVSTFLHQLDVGAIIEARGPAGAFTLRDDSSRTSVLIAAGIGITPMMAMLRHRLFEERRTRHAPPTWLFYSARSMRERAFDEELASLAADGQKWLRTVRVLADTAGAVEARDYDVQGRITAALIASHLPVSDCDFYLCGPAGFMQDVYDGLRDLGVPDQNIHAEAFGPAALRRKGSASALAPLPDVSSRPVGVRFERSRVEAVWEPGSGSLLDVAERAGLTLNFSCRSGICGSCRAPVTGGPVTYEDRPAFDVPAGEALLCCALPAQTAPAEDGQITIEA
jgi:ferredoxin-NADP reductase/predicted pyridoxine 5'-phosphate oxidase superfamily flavin-nucleotide-binding protein